MKVEAHPSHPAAASADGGHRDVVQTMRITTLVLAATGSLLLLCAAGVGLARTAMDPPVPGEAFLLLGLLSLLGVLTGLVLFVRALLIAGLGRVRSRTGAIEIVLPLALSIAFNIAMSIVLFDAKDTPILEGSLRDANATYLVLVGLGVGSVLGIVSIVRAVRAFRGYRSTSSGHLASGTPNHPPQDPGPPAGAPGRDT